MGFVCKVMLLLVTVVLLTEFYQNYCFITLLLTLH